MTWQEFFTEVWNAEILSWWSVGLFGWFAFVGMFFR